MDTKALIKLCPHRVYVYNEDDPDTDGNFYERLDWCDEHCEGLYYLINSWSGGFEIEEEAFAFKMRWL